MEGISSARRSLLCVALAAVVLCPLGLGCSRAFWRKQADADSYEAVTQKLNDPRWALPRIDVKADPRSRFFDPYDPDHEPLPPDDPAAHTTMHWVDGWQGYKGWHKFGDLLTVENPQWYQQFGLSTDMVDALTGEYVDPTPTIENLSLVQAVELAQLHNREYQLRIEDVYLNALAVTFERFRFAVRYLGPSGQEPSAGLNSTFIPHGPGDNAVGDASFGVSQLLPAGTQWAVELANNTLWLFGGGSQTSSVSNLSFSLIQPLLANAGRKVGLESLTQAERNLLYSVRDLARFRQVLFTNVVGNGYLQLLQQVQQIRNARGNIRRLEEQVDRLQAESESNRRSANAELLQMPEGLEIPPELQGQLLYYPDLQRIYWRGPISDEQVEILRNLSTDPAFQRAAEALIQSLQTEVGTLNILSLQSQLTNSINSLRSSERQLQDSLDTFKFLLGLPTDMVVTINESLLEPFNVIDPRLSLLEEEIKDFVDVWGAIEETDPPLGELQTNLAQFSQLVQDVEENALGVVANDIERVREALPGRLEYFKDPADRELLQSDIERFEFLFQQASQKLEEIQQSTEGLQRLLNTDNPDLPTRSNVREDINRIRLELLRLVQNLTVVQISFRVELVDVAPFQIALHKAVAYGVQNRVDLMNTRATVMDARRKMEIAANQLQASLDLVVQGDINTPPGTKPFDFRGSQSSFRTGIRFTAPLDQINERNAYRQTLINYQRARREYMQTEDQVKQQIRVAWRQLVVLRQNLETSRRAIRLAALQYDSAVIDSSAPVQPGQAGSQGVQGTNLLNALDRILSAQNNFVSNYMSYESFRLNIYRDMGMMEIGPDGLWDDPFYRDLRNEEQSESSRQFLDLGAANSIGRGIGGRGLGQRPVSTVMVAIPDGVVPANAEGAGTRHRATRAVSR